MCALVQQKQANFENVHTLHYDSTGIICLSQVVDGHWSNRYYNYASLKKTLNDLDLENIDALFFSQNTFKKFRRSSEHLFELKACYMDLDYYHLKLTKEQVLFGLDELVREHSIPIPTMIIDSGHGMYVIWRIKRIPAMAVKLWRAMEEYLFSQLEPLGADRSCIDPVRVFRVADSYNCKYPQKQKVQVISNYAIEYDLHDLQEQFLTRKKQNATKKKQRGRIVRIRNIYTLYCNRRMDILSLCKMREFEMTGMRELVLFLYRYYGCLQYTDERAIDMILELNEQFTEPCRESTVLRATRSAERAAALEKYNYKNSTIIELLQITDEEMQQKNAQGEYILQTLISKKEKYRRKNEKRNGERRNSQGNTSREQNVCDALEMIRTLKEKGYTQNQIAKEMNMTIRNVQNYYRKLREEKKHLY